MEEMNQESSRTYSKQDTNRTSIGFFSLKDDKDSAVVRFMIDSIEEVPIIKLHKVRVGNKDRKISCLRDPKEPVENCPLCSAGKSLSSRVFIPLIEYVKSEDGKVYPMPKVWERPASYLSRLVNLYQEYGNLSDNLFRVVRNGAAGSTNTTYSENYCKPEVFKDSIYVKNDELFKGFSVMGRLVSELTYEEAEAVVSGDIPEKFNNKVNSSSYAEKKSTEASAFTPMSGATTVPSAPRPTERESSFAPNRSTYSDYTPTAPSLRNGYQSDETPSRPSRRTYY